MPDDLQLAWMVSSLGEILALPRGRPKVVTRFLPRVFKMPERWTCRTEWTIKTVWVSSGTGKQMNPVCHYDYTTVTCPNRTSAGGVVMPSSKQQSANWNRLTWSCFVHEWNKTELTDHVHSKLIKAAGTRKEQCESNTLITPCSDSDQQD